MRIFNKLSMILLLLYSIVGTAQTVFRGTVIDATTKQPISNARVGINNQGVGEITNDKGFFNYRKYHEVVNADSQLVVSASGYESLQLDAEKVRVLFNISSKIELQPRTQKEQSRKIKDLTVFWDVSENMQGRDVEAEVAYVEKYVSIYKDLTLRLVVFDYGVRNEELITIRDGDISRFRESVSGLIYNGPSNYDVLDIADADAVILSSNGNPNFGTFQVSQEVPVYAIASKKIATEKDYMTSLAKYTQGRYTPIQEYKGVSSNRKTTVEKVQGPVIRGSVTSLGKPLQEVSIIKKGDYTEYLTKANGSFELPAKEGDILQVRYLGMFPKDVLVSDKKNVSIELLPDSDVLDEVVLEKKIEKIIVGDKEIRGRKVSPHIPGGVTSLGDFYITSSDIKPDGKPLEYVIREHFKRVRISYTSSGVRLLINEREPAFFINDRLIYNPSNNVSGPALGNIDEALAILDQDIESIVIKESPAITTRYGRIMQGLAVIITTKNAPLAKAKQKNSALAKDNDYTEEVTGINEVIASSFKEITGKVTSLGNSIQGATINKKGTFEEYNSKVDGSFKMYAKEGDQVVVSYLGMYPTGFVVDDKTSYAVNLVPKSDMLNEVVLNGENKSEELKSIEATNEEYKQKLYGQKVLTKDEIKKYNTHNIIDLISGRFSGTQTVGVYPNQVIVNPRSATNGPFGVLLDGVLYDQSILDFINIDTVAKIEVVNAAFSAAVGQGGGGVIRITTIAYDDSLNLENKEIPSPLVDGNDYEEEVTSLSDPLLDSSSKVLVRGVVRSINGFLSDATITRKGSFDEVYTDAQGAFAIKASLGDVLVISNTGMFPKEVRIETQDVGSIELTPKNDALDEVIVAGDKRVDNTIERSDGRRVNKDKLGYAASEITENNFADGATNLQQLITGKVSGVTVEGGLYSGSDVVYKIRGGNQSIENEIPPIWIVNGIPYPDPPNFLDVQQIASITVLKSATATSRYGTLAAGGAFLIKTKEVSFQDKAKKAQQSALVNGNEYTEASTRDIDTSTLPEYILRLREIPDLQEQFEAYQRISRTQESPLEFYVDVAQYFEGINKYMANQVRADLAYISRNNTKALRTLCYIYEVAGDYDKAALVYERILKIAPSEAQSYRDLALIYQEIGKYNEALELYYNMLGEQIKGVDFKGLENSLRNELSRLLTLHKDKVDFERFPNEWLRVGFDIDIRMVIDWSDRSVPFEFQFVNPDKKFFKWTHTLDENRDRLVEEQAQGYQSEEFIIDDAPPGEWLINIQYLGDEGDYVLPPFLKYTVYKNYGTPEETKEIKIVKLFKQSDKVTLGKVML